MGGGSESEREREAKYSGIVEFMAKPVSDL
jgi:hypothetical protein